MKRLQYFTALLLLLLACNENDDLDFGEKPAGGTFSTVIDEENPLQVRFVPQNVDTTQVKLAWDFGYIDTNRNDRSIEFSPVVTFPDEGDYTVTMTTYNDAGITATKQSISLRLPPGPNIPPDFQLLAGTVLGRGKAWVVDRYTDGHSSAGRVSTPGDYTSFWSRPANNMECLGMYNDVYIFNFEEGKLEDNEFVLSTGGDVYTRANLDGNFDSSMTAAEVGCFDVPDGEDPPVLSGGDRVATYESPGNLTYNLSTRSDGARIVSLSSGGYLGMWVETQEYEILLLEENVLELGFTQGSGTVNWRVRLVALPEAAYDLTGGTLEGKTWVIDKDTDGHSAAGRVSSGNETDFWSRPAGAMECLGLYNDEYTFKLDGLELAIDTGGDVYTRNQYLDQYPLNTASGDICPGGTVSGNDYRADFVSPGGITWNMLTREEDGITLIRVSDSGYIGMDVDAPEYEILVVGPEELYVRFVQSVGTVAWYKRLIPKD